LAAVLDAEHRIHQARLDLLRAEADAQTALAAIERLIGAEL
jgi:cobalt-zinc-cadmium efflux system outer membrane protein